MTELLGLGVLLLLVSCSAFVAPAVYCSSPAVASGCASSCATGAFASRLFMSSSMIDKKIYGVSNSGWKSPQWNWGSAVGTGHDCAAICRRTYSTSEAREELVSSLLSGEITIDFEEVKLTMALAWQNGRWDGSDGGAGGYGDVLQTMAQAERYEEGSEVECAQNLTEDMRTRFALLKPTTSQMTAMERLLADSKDALEARNRCSGLVLQAMGFVENG